MQQKYPYVRRADEKDYPSIWSIWMQDHVIRWMSFPPQSLEDFKKHYDKLNSTSDIYVMVDQIGGEEEVVGVRRIKYLKGDQSHIAELCSLGIGAEYQGKGYGLKFYDEFEKIVAANKNIKRIQLTQSGGNERAFFLGAKKGYQEEAVFPDWLERSGKNDHHYFVIESFIYKITDQELQSQATKIPTLTYQARLPSLNKSGEKLSVTLGDNKLIVRKGKESIIEMNYYPDSSVIQHIGFLDNIILYSTDDKLNQAALREALIFIAKENRVKKVELFTSNVDITALCEDLGFWVRGERIASSYYDGQYHNELGVEYSFFDIKDASELLKSFDLMEKDSSLEKSLQECHQIIEQMYENDLCDQLGKQYLENIIYQMVRDSLHAEKLISLHDQPWRNVIAKCPSELKIALHKLDKQLQREISSYVKLASVKFFKQSPAPVGKVEDEKKTFTPKR